MVLNREQNTMIEIARTISNASFYDMPVTLEHIDFNNLDWEAMERYIIKHKVLLLYFNYIKQYMPAQVYDKINKLFEERIKKTRIYLNEIKRIDEIFKKNNYSMVLIKGAALSQLIYQNLFAREFNDLDVFAYEVNDIESLIRLKNLLVNEYGYKQVHIGTHEYVQLDDLGVFHEFIIKRKDKKSGTSVGIEIKQSSSAIKIDCINQFLSSDNLKSINIEGKCIITSDLIHTFLHLCANIYGDTEKRIGVERKNLIRDIIDVSVFINKYCTQLEWNRVKMFSEQYGISYKVYNVLRRLQLLGFKLRNVDKGVLILFEPSLEDQKKYRINAIGEKVDWTLFPTPLDRIFSVKGRNSEYVKLQYLKNASERNLNFQHAKEAFFTESNEKMQWDIVSTKIFDLNLLYRFVYDRMNNVLNINLKAKKNDLCDLPFLVQFAIYTGDRPCFVYIDLSKSILEYFISTPADRSANISKFDLEKHQCHTIIDQDEIILTVPFSLDLLPRPLKSRYVCYNVVTHKYTTEKTSLIVDVKYSEPYDAEEWYDDMGVIKLFD